MTEIVLSAEARFTAGILLLSIVAVEFGRSGDARYRSVDHTIA